MDLFSATLIAEGEFEMAGYLPSDDVEAEDLTVEAFQLLVSTGMAWQLPGRVGRMAASLIDAGLVQMPEEAA